MNREKMIASIQGIWEGNEIKASDYIEKLLLKEAEMEIVAEKELRKCQLSADVHGMWGTINPNRTAYINSSPYPV